MRVMVVDDERDFLRMTSVIFELYNHDVINAAGGRECLEKLENEKPPDIILLDLVMADISGYEICRRIKSNSKFRDIPVIMLSGKAGLEADEQAYENGADSYIEKPIDPYDLLKRVESFQKITH